MHDCGLGCRTEDESKTRYLPGVMKLEICKAVAQANRTARLLLPRKRIKLRMSGRNLNPRACSGANDVFAYAAGLQAPAHNRRPVFFRIVAPFSKVWGLCSGMQACTGQGVDLVKELHENLALALPKVPEP